MTMSLCSKANSKDTPSAEKCVEDPMAEELLKGKFTEGSSIKIKYSKKNDNLVFVDITKETSEKETDETVEEK